MAVKGELLVCLFAAHVICCRHQNRILRRKVKDVYVDAICVLSRCLVTRDE